ncbi:cell division protein FtsL [Thiotrichales bacterium 19S3-7]|nr:cell division protein FtsL [Thiotrichales bacterium 19S3-7]MCF6802450.1 cell division protein FtsL [Thiotrichales bacterium 19S3-11]
MQISRNEVRKRLFETISASFFNLQFLIVIILSVLVLASSFAVLHQKLKFREATIQYQNYVKEKESLHIQWTQLLLEHSTLASPARVERVAKDTLKMHLPSVKDIQLIKEP